jgi:hypothetical protein
VVDEINAVVETEELRNHAACWRVEVDTEGCAEEVGLHLLCSLGAGG